MTPLRTAVACAASGLVLWLLPAVAGFAESSPTGEPIRIRLGISERMVAGDVNENDARTALLIWVETLGRHSGIAVECERNVLSSTERIVQALRAREMDGVGVTTPEYMDMIPWLDTTTLLMDADYSEGGEEYLLVVHADSDVRTTADLRGRTLMLSSSPKTAMAAPWLETLLATVGMAPSRESLGRIISKSKVSQVILPVYFKQADAFIATRRSLDTMRELNPQIGTKLRIIATSPRMISNLLAFHKDCPQLRKTRLINALMSMHTTSTGQQALMLFQSRKVGVGNSETLRSSLEVLKQAQRIKGRGGTGKK